jgi:hypothetical protein
MMKPAIALGSTWERPSCDVTVSGDFGPGLTGDGAWIDYSNGWEQGLDCNTANSTQIESIFARCI